jgi:DNA polymerase-1
MPNPSAAAPARTCAVPDDSGWRWRALPDDAGGSSSADRRHGDRQGTGADLVAASRADDDGPDGGRLVWPDAASCYPLVRRAGLRIARCHDLALIEALLLGHEGRWGEPRSPAAAWARLVGAPVPADEPERPGDEQDTLFDTATARIGPALANGADPLDAAAAVHADQQARIARARATSPGFGLLVAAESASALAAVEMSQAGLPWRVDVHDALLGEALGPRPTHGGRPPRMQTLAEEVARQLGDPRLNPDSQAEVLRALRRAGVDVRSTRARELRRVEHPVIEPLLAYKKLARLHAANGWAWRERWVVDGRFHPEYVPGGVVSGRWASRGGGALQIPRAVRPAVVADPGRVLVIADAGQLEPRVLAALSGDVGLVAATRAPDLYTTLAATALGRAEARDEAKVGLLSAMYGGGAGTPALAALRRRFPAALELLEDAAKVGEDGGSVRSVLGRTSPPARPDWLDGLSPEAAVGRSRGYGRFTRNFVVQASAADWASVLIAGLRTRLHRLRGGSGPDGAFLVFFQHDEVMVEAPEDAAEPVIAAIADAGAEATRLVLGDVQVSVPLQAVAVRCYAEKH